MRVVLIWPRFKSQSGKDSPPLGLLKIAGYHRAQGDDVLLVRSVGPLVAREGADRVYVSSLFTYDREPVVKQIRAASSAWSGVDVRVGGIWASLLPDEVRYVAGIEPYVGLWDLVEDEVPAWDLWPGEMSAAFASRGCIRACPWCSVARLDGPGFCAKAVDLVLAQLDLGRPKVELWDFNVLAHPDFDELAGRLIALKKRVVVGQGLDARLLTREKAALIRAFRGGNIYLAYDQESQREAAERAICYLGEAGQSKGHILVFSLYNFYDPVSGAGDTPDEVYDRIDEILGWGARVYPLRYRPINSSERLFISPKWGWDELRRFNRARGDLSRGTGVVYRSLREYVDWKS